MIKYNKRIGSGNMIEYIILIGIIIIIILSIISVMKNINESNITERLGKLETNTIKELSAFKIDMMKNMNEDFDRMNEMLEYRLTMMNEKVNERLDENFDGLKYKGIEAILSYQPEFCHRCGCIFNKEQTYEKNGFKTSDILMLDICNHGCILSIKKQRFLCHSCNKKFFARTKLVNDGCFISNQVKYSIAWIKK